MNPTSGWVPSDEVVARSVVSQFAASVGAESFAALHTASIEDPAWFWDEAVRFLGIPFTEPYTTVLDVERGPAWAEWFVGGRTNASAMCVDRWLATGPDVPAIEWFGEDGSERVWTRRELHEQIEGLAALLR